MNLNKSPSIIELQSLLASCNDDAGHHVVWVDGSGEVHITCLSQTGGLAGFRQKTPEMRLKYEILAQGNDYVGEAAAKDEKWVASLLRSILKAWVDECSSDEVLYIV